MAEAGRPTEYTDETVNRLSDAFKDGANITQACLLSGISRETYYTWLKEKPGFSDKMDSAQQWPSVIARRSVVKAISQEEVNPQRFGTDNSWKWLERKNKDEFSTRSELTGKDNQPLIPKPILGGQAENVPSDNGND